MTKKQELMTRGFFKVIDGCKVTRDSVVAITGSVQDKSLVFFLGELRAVAKSHASENVIELFLGNDWLHIRFHDRAQAATAYKEVVNLMKKLRREMERE